MNRVNENKLNVKTLKKEQELKKKKINHFTMFFKVFSVVMLSVYVFHSKRDKVDKKCEGE